MKIRRHSDINGGLAINVKSHGMRFADGGTDAQRVRAGESAQLEWWTLADEAAKECGYAGATACGRMGGWCAPYDEPNTFVHDSNAPGFLAFAERIEKLHADAPQMFADTLAAVIEEEAQETRDEERAAQVDAARAAMPGKLAAALRAVMNYTGGWDAPAPHPCGIGRDTLADYDAMQPGSPPQSPTAAAGPLEYRAEGVELIGFDWDNGPEAWDVIRNQGEEWVAFSNPAHTAAVVDALNTAPHWWGCRINAQKLADSLRGLIAVIREVRQYDDPQGALDRIAEHAEGAAVHLGASLSGGHP
jgi:hypothetical protein